MSEKEYVFVGNAQLKTRDYIKNIERENRNLQQKIDKAIEYIKRLKNFKIKCVLLEEKELYVTENDFIKELLEILGDKENE